ncbi:MAG: beta-ketoacyl synthase N-terminal-like domain-containing protein [Anaerolineaceae bacterium]|nr:beta-ketoacyl synthase N-terminal-like domain-containing protein [Anaerolineaceae bacterium]
MVSKSSKKTHDINYQLRNTPVAVIGMASIFPQASNLQEYWDNILNKINCVTEVPASRWSVEDYYDPDPHAPDKSYCKRGGFLPEINFDPTEFGLPPNILEVTDVSQLLSLVVAKDVLEDAGYGEGREFDRENTGVILGVVGVSTKLYVPLMARLQYPIWEKVLKASGVSDQDTQKLVEKMKLAYVGWEENSFPGSLANVVSGRVANRFDLGGTNCVLDAACATSLAAIKMAVMELVEGRSNMMITGGVDTDNSIGVYMSFSKTPAFSKGESVRTFDAESDGMMAGEGIGMVVLKRLADAERDGDRIYAVIRGIGSSSDGRFKSIYAPRPDGQAKALRRAYEEAGYSPATVGLIEAHGTGTPAGDPAEFSGLRQVFDEGNPNRQYIALGSVKSQIAHTKGAAGSASLIKASMALYNKVLPPTINVTRPNPKLDVESSSFYINTETRPWFRFNAETPRRAGISSFGFGGTNFHIALEEYQSDHQAAYRFNSVAQTVLLSASSSKDLLAICQDTLAKLQGDQAAQFYNELVNTSQTAEPALEHARLGFVAGSLQEAKDFLQTSIDFIKQKPDEAAWDHPKGIYYRKMGIDPKGKVVGLFSGQGSQYLEMGRELQCNFPPMRQVFAEMDNLFIEDGLKPISSRVFPAPVFEQDQKNQLSDTLTRTEHAQPAIGAMSVGLYKLLQQAGFTPDFVAGHSFGELTALWAAGVLSDRDYYYLAKARGKAMSPPDDPNFDSGTMLAVKGDDHKIAEEIKDFPEITLANWNSANQVVLAGAKPAIAKVQQYLTDKGYSAVLLPVSAAFHTPLVGHAQKPFADAIDKVTFNAPKARLFSNSTGKAHSSNPDEIRKVLKKHILNPVLFKDEIENIYAEGGTIFVEFGPKNVLTNLVKNILGEQPHLAVALNASPKKDSDRQFREAVLQLRVAGMKFTVVDPYQAPFRRKPARKNSAATVVLNGGSYVSPKTVAAFEKSLQDGFKVSSTVIQVQASPLKPVTSPIEAPAQAVPAASSASPAVSYEYKPQGLPENSPANPAEAGLLEQNLAQFREHQSEVVHLHEQYLNNEEEYGKIYAKLSELEIALISNASQDKLDQIVPVFEGLERSMARFHDHQAETLRVHAQYLKSQEEFSQNFVKLVEQQIGSLQTGAPRLSVPVPPVKTEGIEPKQVVAVPQKVQPVAEPKSTPAQKTPPVTSPAAPSAGNGNGANHALPGQISATSPKAGSPGYDVETLTGALLKVVSEKTGYPVEMLELSSDMEADLGIDSIKRVEIMGAMRTQFTNLPKADPEAFAEMRTLGQIVQYMSASPAQIPSAPAETLVEATAVTALQTPAESPAAELITSGETAAEGYDEKTLTTALLAVVSEKTGYPVEMLELSSDMEADLGIDSIKRVEIMGALRAQFPNLPKADPEAFAEMRTLGQIIQYMSRKTGQAANTSAPTDATVTNEEVPPAAAQDSAPVETAAAETASSEYDNENLKTSLLSIVSEKTGYPVEMLDLSLDLEADLGIDSIKRVEIMGALRAQFPNLPKADPEAFAEARTLGKIIDYLSKSDSPEKAAAQPAVEVKSAAPEISIPRGVVNLRSLPEPDFSNFSLPDKYICLLTDNGTYETVAVAQQLIKRNWKLVVLSFPTSLVVSQLPLPEGVDRVTLNDLSEGHLQQQLADISKKYGPVAALVHLNPPVTISKTDSIFSEVEKEIIRHVFLLAKHLKEPLTTAARIGNGVFMLVVNLDGEFGLGNEMDFDPISGGLFGLAKTVNLEWEAVYCRAVDISPRLDPEQAAQNIVAELFDPNRVITEVGYSSNGRSTLVIEEALEIEEME